MESQYPAISPWSCVFQFCVAVLLVASSESTFAQSRVNIPSIERQKEITKDLEGAYDLTRMESVAKKQDAAMKLMEASRDEGMSTDERYVVLLTVITLTKETSDVAKWLEAVNALVDMFAVDPQKEKSRLLMEFLQARKPGDQHKLAVEEAIAISHVAARENRYADATSLLNSAAASIRRAAGTDSLKKLVTEAISIVAAREKEWKAFQAACKKLEANADDPPANFVVGRWHALQEADWKTALPFLVKANDPKWKAAAQIEQVEPSDAMAQVAIGDAWFEIGEAEVGTARTALHLHAGKWYEEAHPQLDSVLKKQAILKRLDKIASLKATVAPPKKAWHGWPIAAPPPAIVPFDAKQAKRHQEAWASYLKIPVDYTNNIGMKFRLVPPGEYLMGSKDAEIEQALVDAGRDENLKGFIRSEGPQHNVILTQPIYVGVHEVTQVQYEKVMGKSPALFSPMGEGKSHVAGMDTTNHPVEMVSWNDAAEFCTKLTYQAKLKPFYLREGETITLLNGTGYRLPTEAEWEFVCCAGTTTRFWHGDKDDDLVPTAWSGMNAGERTHAVGKLQANPFGIFDLHGNVWEWVHDGWQPTYYGEFINKPAINPSGSFPAGLQRVIRGGAWNDIPSWCRARNRFPREPTFRKDNLGFRVSLMTVGSHVNRP